MADLENIGLESAAPAQTKAPPKKDSFLLEFLDMKGVLPGQSSTMSVTSGRSFASRTIKIPRVQTGDLQMLPPDYTIYDKYKSMLRVGLQEEQIRHKMIQDGLHPDGLFNNPIPTNQSMKKGKKRKGGKIGKTKRASKVLEQFAPNSAVYDKYIKLLELGMPEGPVLQRLVYDGLDPDGFLGSDAYKVYLDKEAEEIMKNKLEILKMTLPKIKAKPNRADFTGVHAILGEFFKDRVQNPNEEGGVTEKPKFNIPKKELVALPADDETYQKYGKMFGVGLSEAQVLHKVIMDGLDPSAFMESDVYNGYLEDEALKRKQQKLELLKNFLPKMQIMEQKNRAASVSKADFAEVQNLLDGFLKEKAEKQATESVASKKESIQYEAPPVELKSLPPTNPLWEKYAKMISIGLKEGVVLHKLVYDGLEPESFMQSIQYNLVMKQQRERTKRAKLKILGIFLPKAQQSVKAGEFEQHHLLLSQLFEKKGKKSAGGVQKARASFKTMRPKKLRKLHADDPSFENYGNMLRIGISEAQVMHKLVYDGVEPESFLDSTEYRGYLKEQQDAARERKIALLRQFIPQLDQGDEEDEDEDEEEESAEASQDAAAKAAEKKAVQEKKEQTLKENLADLNEKVTGYFSSWWR